MTRIGGLLCWIALLVACGPAGDPALAGFESPRTVHVTADGRIIVADLGDGSDDGRVVAVDLDAAAQEVLMDGLPSTSDSGQRYADLAGPSGAAMAPDGTACAAVGDAVDERFSMLICSDGLTVNLETFEGETNPDRDEIASNPFDVAPDGDAGWFVTDAAANAVLRVDRGGTIEVVAAFESLEPLIGEDVDAVPTGVVVVDDALVVCLYGGAVVRIGADGAPEMVARLETPIALAPTSDDAILVLSHERGAVYRVAVGGEPEQIASGLDRPTGLARLGDGRLVVAEQEAGRVGILAAP